MLQIYDKLLELPLFLGIGAEDLSQIVGSTKFSFLKLKPNAVLLKENDKCTQLYFLMGGKLSVRSQADDHSYSIEEEIDAPAVIQPEHMFGLMQHHSKTYTAATDCNLLSIDKNEILRLSENYLIFRLNFFNMLSTQAQRHGRLPWQQQPRHIRDKFIHFVRTHCSHQGGTKKIEIKMQKLADEIHESRLNVSVMLNRLNDEKLIILTRGQIIIPQLEKLR